MNNGFNVRTISPQEFLFTNGEQLASAVKSPDNYSGEL